MRKRNSVLRDKHLVKEVYLIRASNGLYKIGSTVDTGKRMAALQSASPCVLELVYAITVEWESLLEYQLQDRFRGKCTHSEWFRLDREDVEYITSISNGFGLKLTSEN